MAILNDHRPVIIYYWSLLNAMRMFEAERPYYKKEYFAMVARNYM